MPSIASCCCEEHQLWEKRCGSKCEREFLRRCGSTSRGAAGGGTPCWNLLTSDLLTLTTGVREVPGLVPRLLLPRELLWRLSDVKLGIVRRFHLRGGTSLSSSARPETVVSGDTCRTAAATAATCWAPSDQ